ncbi:hypothetical protein [Streptomyces sp. NPDC007063]|uniref:hypothetical protein n=1 Tax=Streptomyces sp. NPDC007063 TaxID=3364772 RepID=UPI0036B0A7F4
MRMSIPMPADPRTPLQAAQDRLAAARKRLVDQELTRQERREVADTIWELKRTIATLEKQGG